MSEKHLTEPLWKALVAKQGVKDIGLQKALAGYAKLDASKEPASVIEALKEISDLAAKLKKTCAAKKDVVEHLDEMVKEMKMITPALEAKVKAMPKPGEPDIDDEEEEAAEFKKDFKKQMLSALAQVKVRAPGDPQQEKEPKPQLKFMAYLAGPGCAVIVARKVGAATKKLLPEILGVASGGKFVLGECIFEKSAHTFVLEQVPTGLAKKLAAALLAATGARYKVRVRSTDGSVTLDSETDTGEDTATVGKDPSALFNHRLAALVPEIKSVAGTPSGDEAKLKASEAGVFARKKEFAQANALLDQAEAALKGSAASKAKSPSVTGAPPGRAAGLVEKRKFLIERWQRIPPEVHANLKGLQEAIEREMPDEDAGVWIELAEEYLDEFFNEMKDAIDDDINSGDAQYKKAVSKIQTFRASIAKEPLIQHLKANTLKVNVPVEATLLNALAEVEQALAN